MECHRNLNFIGSSDFVALYGNGAQDTVYNNTSKDVVDLAQGTTASVNGQGGNISLIGSNVNLTTSGESISSIDGLGNDIINGSNDILAIGNYSQDQVIGANDTIDLNGSYDNVTVSDQGTTDTIQGLNATDTLGAASNSVLSTSGTGATIDLNGSQITDYSSNDSIAAANYAANDIINGSYDNISAGIDFYNGHLVGNSDSILLGNAGTAGSGGVLYVQGTYDHVTGNDGTIYFVGSHLGDTVTGNDMQYFVSGFAGDRSVVDARLKGDASQASASIEAGNSSLGSIAAAARAQAAAALANNYQSSVSEAAQWAKPVVTWSLASAASNSGAYDAYIDHSYSSQIAQAFQTWGGATGLTFEQVADGSPSDIELGWSALDTASTSAVGYTALKSDNGVIRSGVQILLEDPSQTAFAASGGGQWAYSGTDATFEQVLLHEIGHALGFADNANPNSILSYYLGADNRTLSAADLAGANELYGLNNASAALLPPSAAALIAAPH